MARLGVSVVGGIIGAFFGMPALGFMVGSLIGGLLFPPKISGQDVVGPRLDDLRVSTSSYGTPITLAFGRTRLAGTVVWSTDLKETVKKESFGGKGAIGGGGGTSRTFSYSVSFAIAFCHGPVSAFGRVWADGKLIYDPAGAADVETYEFTLRKYLGTEDQLPDSLIEEAVGVDNTPGYRGLAYLVFEDLQLEDFGNRIPSISAEVERLGSFAHSTDPTSASLHEIVKDVVQRSGLQVADITLTRLTDGAVRGYYIARPTTPRAVLQQLAETYFFDVCESNGVLDFNDYGGAPVVTIAQQDLVASDGDRISNPLKEVRKQVLEVPYKIFVAYNEPEQDYQTGTQYAARTQVHAHRDMNEVHYVELPIAMSATQARRIAERMLYVGWIERSTYETKLPWRYLALDPTDVVQLDMDDGRSLTTMIGKAATGADLSIETMLIGQDAETFVETDTAGGTAEGFRPQVLTSPVEPTVFIIDTPYLRDIDDAGQAKALTYLAAGSDDADYSGAFAYVSFDNGVNWDAIGQFTTSIAYGQLLALPATDVSFLDINALDTLDVQMTHGTLASVTEAEMLAGANAAVIGAPGRWEVVQFQTAAVTGPDTYTLSITRRGQRGTEWAIPLHQANDTFILLDAAGMLAFLKSMDEVGQQGLIKAVPKGGSLATATTYSETLRASTLRPYAPVFQQVTDSVDGLTVAWLRRTRFGGGASNGVDTSVPLNEEIEHYNIYLLDAPYTPAFNPLEPTHYRRLIAAHPFPWYLYTTAEMTADGYDKTTDTLYAVVYQMSATAGHGFPCPIAVTPAEFV